MSNAFETFIMSIHVQAFKDRVGAMCKDVGPCVDGELRGAIGSKMRRGIFGLDEMFATVAHVLSIAGFERLANVRVKNRRVVS